MAFSTNNIGKNCYINMSEDENVEDSLYGTIIGYYKDTDKNEEYYFVSINGNVERIYDDSLVNIIEDGGGGSSAVSSVNGQTGTVVLTASDVGAEPEKFVVTVSDDGQGNLSADKTFAQISAALQDKEEVVVKYYGYTMYFAADLGGAYAFTTLLMLEDPDNIGYSKRQLVVFSQNNIDTWLEYQELFAPSPSFDTPGSGVVSIEPKNNYAYKCGTLTSLTITDPPATGSYSIVFTSGSTATTTTIPATILGLEDFAPEADTVYEINVLDNRAVVGSWAVR